MLQGVVLFFHGIKKISQQFFSPIVAKAAYMDVLILTLYRNHSYHIHDQMQFASEEQAWNVVLPLVR